MNKKTVFFVVDKLLYVEVDPELPISLCPLIERKGLKNMVTKISYCTTNMHFMKSTQQKLERTVIWTLPVMLYFPLYFKTNHLTKNIIHILCISRESQVTVCFQRTASEIPVYKNTMYESESECIMYFNKQYKIFCYK